MKRLLAVILACSMILSLSACGGQKEKDSTKVTLYEKAQAAIAEENYEDAVKYLDVLETEGGYEDSSSLLAMAKKLSQDTSEDDTDSIDNEENTAEEAVQESILESEKAEEPKAEVKPTEKSTESGDSGKKVETTTQHTHTWGEGVITEAATCTSSGIKTRTCSCGQTSTVVIPATGHTIVTDAATSELTEGSHCSVCGQVIVAQEKKQTAYEILGNFVKNNGSYDSSNKCYKYSCVATSTSTTTATEYIYYYENDMHFIWEMRCTASMQTGTIGDAYRVSVYNDGLDKAYAAMQLIASTSSGSATTDVKGFITKSSFTAKSYEPCDEYSSTLSGRKDADIKMAATGIAMTISYINTISKNNNLGIKASDFGFLKFK